MSNQPTPAYQDPPAEPGNDATIAEIDAYLSKTSALMQAGKLHPVPVAALRRAGATRRVRLEEAEAAHAPETRPAP